MQADWEVEVGGQAPVIEALWPGFIDLRTHPEAVHQLPEVASQSALGLALGRALVALNGPSSPVWTTKCDLWQLENVDPDEFDAPTSMSPVASPVTRPVPYARACYIDLLPLSVLLALDSAVSQPASHIPPPPGPISPDPVRQLAGDNPPTTTQTVSDCTAQSKTECWFTVDQTVLWCRSLCARLWSTPVHSCRVDLIVRQASLAPDRMGFAVTAYLAGCGQTMTEADHALDAALAAFARVLSTKTPSAA